MKGIRTNIPTAEFENLMRDEDKKPIELKYPRNPDLDPQLVWRGKDDQDWSDWWSLPHRYIFRKN